VATYTIFGQAITGPVTLQANANVFTLGMEFEVSRTMALTGVWWYSAKSTDGSGPATLLPDDSGVWVNTGAGTGTSFAHHATASWSGAAGSGWVKDSYPGTDLLLSGSKYIVAVARATAVNFWFTEDNFAGSYWTSGAGAPGSNGITNGPLSAPNVTNALATSSQAPFVAGTWAYPNGTGGNTGFNFYVDVEVSDPAGGTPAPYIRNYSQPSITQVIRSGRMGGAHSI